MHIIIKTNANVTEKKIGSKYWKSYSEKGLNISTKDLFSIIGMNHIMRVKLYTIFLLGAIKAMLAPTVAIKAHINALTRSKAIFASNGYA